MCILGHLVDVLCKDVIFSRVNKKGLPESFLLCAHLCDFVLQNHTDIHAWLFSHRCPPSISPTHTLSLHAGWQRLQHWKVSITVLISLQRINGFYCCADGTFGVINFFNLFKMSQDGGECIYFPAVTPVGRRCQL